MKKIKSIVASIVAKFAKVNSRRKIYARKILSYIQIKPFKSFFAVLGVFLLLMIVGKVLFSPKPPAPEAKAQARSVKVYKLGSAPEVTYQGKIEKSGVVKIVAQTSGIVSSINVLEGAHVGAGTNILSLSTNYSGGNAPTIARQMAQTQYQTAKDTLNTQKDLIGNQRTLADQNKDNADTSGKILNQSAIDTKALLDLNTTIVNSIAANIQSLEASNVGGANDTAILQAKQSLSQFQAAMTQTNSTLQNLQVQAASAGNAANLSHQIALEQLDLQQKTAETNVEISRLQYNLALVNEANMFPSTPFSATVDKIFVHVGENVSSGTVLASLSGDSQHAEIVVNVPSDIAKNISAFELSTIILGNTVVEQMPTYVSKDATNGVLYSIVYDLDDSLAPKLTDLSFVNVRIPIGVADTTNIAPFIPLDAVIQTQEESYVFIVSGKDTAISKKLTLGQIQGKYVEVLSGLPTNATVILDRNVIEGDKVAPSR